MLPNKQILFELHYLPSIQYFVKIIQFEQVMIEQCENYVKSSYRNRCHILSANGLQRLSIPLRSGKNERQNIQQVQISYDEPWPTQHWNAIRSAYGNSPFFEFYADSIQAIFQQKHTTLFAFNLALLTELLELIGLEQDLLFTPSYQTNPDQQVLDFRNAIHPKSHRALPDPAFQAIPYPQVFAEKTGFIPNLSILDLLFCTGPQTIEYLERSIISPTG